MHVEAQLALLLLKEAKFHVLWNQQKKQLESLYDYNPKKAF
jgi:hypothetical protein